MKSLILTLLTIMACNASAEEVCKNVTFGKHRMDLARPWPTEHLSDRHAQIQQIIASSAGPLSQCGPIAEDLKFTITADGEWRLDDAFAMSFKQVKCFEYYLSRMRFGVNDCGVDIPYKWNGKFPLVNQQAKTFP